MQSLNIVIIDDDESLIETLSEYLKIQGHIVTGFNDSKGGIEGIRNGNFDLLILDYFVDNLNGRQIVQEIRKFNHQIHILLLTGYSNDAPGMELLKELNIQGYVEKNAIQVFVNIETAIKSFQHGRVAGGHEKFSTRLKNIRVSQSVSQDDLAKFCGVGRSTIANYESGYSEPSLEILSKIASYLKVSTDYLLGHSFSSDSSNNLKTKKK